MNDDPKEAVKQEIAILKGCGIWLAILFGGLFLLFALFALIGSRL